MIHLVYDFRNLKMENCCLCPARPFLGFAGFAEITLLVLGILAFAKVHPFGDLHLAYPITFVATSGVGLLADVTSTLIKCFKRSYRKVEREEVEQSVQRLQDNMILIAPIAPETRYYLDLKALCQRDLADERTHLYPVYGEKEKEAFVLEDHQFVLYFDQDVADITHILMQVGSEWQPLLQDLESIQTGYYEPYNPRPTP